MKIKTRIFFLLIDKTKNILDIIEHRTVVREKSIPVSNIPKNTLLFILSDRLFFLLFTFQGKTNLSSHLFNFFLLSILFGRVFRKRTRAPVAKLVEKKCNEV